MNSFQVPEFGDDWLPACEGLHIVVCIHCSDSMNTMYLLQDYTGYTNNVIAAGKFRRPELQLRPDLHDGIDNIAIPLTESAMDFFRFGYEPFSIDVILQYRDRCKK